MPAPAAQGAQLLRAALGARAALCFALVSSLASEAAAQSNASDDGSLADLADDRSNEGLILIGVPVLGVLLMLLLLLFLLFLFLFLYGVCCVRLLKFCCV